MDLPSLGVLYLASEWIVRIIMLVYVPQRRTPSAARTWLLLIFFFPWVGLLAYVILGRTHLPRRRVEDQRRIEEYLRAEKAQRAARAPSPPAPVPPYWAEMARLGENLGGFAVSGGNRVEVLAGYEESLEALITEINSARHHVHLLYYIYFLDRVGERVALALEKAAQRGVQCRLLVDGLGSKRSLCHLEQRFRGTGVELLPLLPPRILDRESPRFDLRNHRKLAVIDGRVGYVGSQNITEPGFVPGHPNEELVLRVTGPVVAQLQSVFIADHYFETGRTLLDPGHFPDLAPTGDLVAQVLPSSPGYQHRNAHQLIVSLVYEARRRVVLTTPYFIPDEPLLLALETAVLGGVEVHVLLSKPVDQFLVSFAQKSYYEQLLRAGVRIHLYRPRFLHTKLLTVDGEVSVVGSSNFDLRSFALNAEVSLVAFDRQLTAQLTAIEERHLESADEITLAAWQSRPWPLRVLQNTARLADAVL